MKKIKFFATWLALGMLMVSCASSSERGTFGPYSAAEAFYKKANYPKAIEKYQEYLTANPRGNLAAIAQYYVGKSYAAMGDTANAVQSYEQVVKQYPQTSWADFAEDQLEILQPPANG